MGELIKSVLDNVDAMIALATLVFSVFSAGVATGRYWAKYDCERFKLLLENQHKSTIASIENTNTTTLANLAVVHDEAIKALQAETIPLVCAIRNNKHNADIEFGRANGVFIAVPPPKIQTRFKQGISVFCDCRYLDVAAKSCMITNQPCKLLGISLSQSQ